MAASTWSIGDMAVALVAGTSLAVYANGGFPGCRASDLRDEDEDQQSTAAHASTHAAHRQDRKVQRARSSLRAKRSARMRAMSGATPPPPIRATPPPPLPARPPAAAALKMRSGGGAQAQQQQDQRQAQQQAQGGIRLATKQACDASGPSSSDNGVGSGSEGDCCPALELTAHAPAQQPSSEKPCLLPIRPAHPAWKAVAELLGPFLELTALQRVDNPYLAEPFQRERARLEKTRVGGECITVHARNMDCAPTRWP